MNSFTESPWSSQVMEDECHSHDAPPGTLRKKMPNSPQRKRRAPRFRNDSVESDVGIFQTMLSQESMGGASQMEWSQQDMSERLGTLSFRTSDEGESLMGAFDGGSGSAAVSRATSFSERFAGDGSAVPLPKPGAVGARSSFDARTRASLDARSSEEGMSFMRRVMESAAGALDDNGNVIGNRNSSGFDKENSAMTGMSSLSGNSSSSTGFSALSQQDQNTSGSASSSGKSSVIETEKKVFIAPPLQNPFLREPERKTKRPLTIMVKPFKERPRYLTDFEEQGTLGEGAFATVLKARRRLDGQLYAIKKSKAEIQGEKGGMLAAREACCMAVLQGCPHVLRYFGCWVENNKFWIQMELCMSLTLDSFIYFPRRPDDFVIPPNDVVAMDAESTNENDDDTDDDEAPSHVTLPEPAVWHVLSAACEALVYMHRRGIAHLDIRPANLLLRDPENCVGEGLRRGAGLEGKPTARQLTADGLVTGKITTCVGDFGMSCRLDESLVLEGADTYMAPELLDADSGALDLTKCDVFSLGVSLYELCRGMRLEDSISDDKVEWHNIRSGRLDEQVMNRISPGLAQIIRACLLRDPAARPDMLSLLNHVKSTEGQNNSLMVRIALLEAELKALRGEAAAVRQRR